jgi:molybdenum cofactor cytidylyltransferase
MGQPKQLLPIGDRPAIAHCLRSITGAGIRDVIVVTGPAGDAVRQAIRGFPVNVAVNAATGSDMAGSVMAGLVRVRPATDGVFVFPCDHPLVTPETLRSMMVAFAAGPGRIIVPRYLERTGHPALFPRAFLEELRKVPTLRDIVWRRPDRVYRLDVDDEGVVLDMDTPEDYQGILARVQAGRTAEAVPAGNNPTATEKIRGSY